MKALYDSKRVTISEICERYRIAKMTFYRTALGRHYGYEKNKRERET
ncbi:MAG: helix-turn-helix domain-containing protein [Zoogloeaceae bacterium]|nr:helix-turn-helix domain-containing protein [Zoogloeaceae bacterium]